MTFSKLAKTLSSSFKVYSIDLPGFGESSIGVPLGVEEVASIIHEFVIRLGLDAPILCGHSYGGRVAIVYASKYSVEKLVLISSAGIKQKLKFSKRFKIRVYKILKKCHMPVKMGSSDYQNADNVKRIMLVKAVNRDLKAEMKLIAAPTLLLYGTKDTVTPLSLGYQIKN
ncbi:MAG: alpha/beta hydrolase, partial [Anaeroplasmataceae bacterium]|nr:alpha/beta hydrolase [Anaeroplasmataceae bacterium]